MVDVPVTVNVQIYDPSGLELTTNVSSVIGSTYIFTSMISSFGRLHSGNYSCINTASSTSLFVTDSRSLSTSANITVGKLLLLIFITV